MLENWKIVKAQLKRLPKPDDIPLVIGYNYDYADYLYSRYIFDFYTIRLFQKENIGFENG